MIFGARTAEENMKSTMEWHRYLGIEVYSLICDDSELQVNFVVGEGVFTNLSHIFKTGDEVEGYISIDSRDLDRDMKRFDAIEKLYGSQMRKIELGESYRPLTENNINPNLFPNSKLD